MYSLGLDLHQSPDETHGSFSRPPHTLHTLHFTSTVYIYFARRSESYGARQSPPPHRHSLPFSLHASAGPNIQARTNPYPDTSECPRKALTTRSSSYSSRASSCAHHHVHVGRVTACRTRSVVTATRKLFPETYKFRAVYR